MVSIVSGNGVGLENSSLGLIGQRGQTGEAAFGRAGERATVNAATGNLVLQGQDELLLGVGPDVGVVRTYNSAISLDGDNNDGWRMSYYRTVSSLAGTVNTAGSTVHRISADGFDATYTYDTASSKYLNKDGEGAYDSLAFNTSTRVWTWTDGTTAVTETYQEGTAGSGAWRLSQVTDPDGNAVRVAYNANGFLSTVQTFGAGEATARETVNLTYDTGTSLLRAISTTYNDGLQTTTRTRVSYAYDNLNRLTLVRTDLSPQDNSVADGRTYDVMYGYDGTSKRVAYVGQTDGTAVFIAYSADGKVASTTDGLGRRTTYTYDTTARTTTVTDPAAQATVFAYDSAGRLIKLSGAVAGGTDTYAYDVDGNLSEYTNALGQKTTYAYVGGNLIRSTDAAGNVAERSYGSRNELLTQTRYLTPDSDGAAGPLLPTAPVATRAVYSAKRELRFEVSAEGRVVEHRYDGFGQQTATLTYGGALRYIALPNPSEADLTSWVAGLADVQSSTRVDYTYDLHGQVASITTWGQLAANGSGVVGTQSIERFTYDAFGNLLQRIDGGGNTTVYAYDGMGRKLFSQKNGGLTQTWLYDDAGNRTTWRQADNYQQVDTYNAGGELISHVEGATATTAWSQSFANDMKGLMGPVSFNTDTGAAVVPATALIARDATAGKLKLSTVAAAAPTVSAVLGDRAYRFDSGNVFSARITTGATLTGQSFTAGVGNDKPGASARYLRVEFSEGKLFVAYIGKDGTPVRQELTVNASNGSPLALEVNMTYGLEIETNELGAQLYFYRTYDANRTAGTRFQLQRSDLADWDVVRSIFTVTSKPGQAVADLYVDDLVEQRIASNGSILWNQPFTASVNGFGEIVSGAPLIGASLGALYFTTQYSGTTVPQHMLVATAQYAQSQGVSPYNEVQLSSSATGRYVEIGADNAAAGTAARKLTARFDGGKLYAVYRDATGAEASVELTSATASLVNGGLYVVQVLPSATDVKLYVFQKNVAGAPMFTYQLQQADWGVVRGTWAAKGTSTTVNAVSFLTRYAEIVAPTASASGITSVQYRYDKLGRQRIVQDATGLKTFTLYDTAGRPVASIDPAGALTETVYDAAGRAVQQVAYSVPLSAAQLASLVDASGNPVDVALASLRPASDVGKRISTQIYDAAGRRVGQQDADGYLTETVSDGAGRVVKTIRYAKATPVSTTPSATLTGLRPASDAANDRIVRNFYDNDGLLRARLDEEGYLTENEYNGLGLQTASTRYLNATPSAARATGDLNALRPAKDVKDQRSVFLYDAASRLVGQLDAEGYFTETSYDANGRVKSVQRYDKRVRATVTQDTPTDPVVYVDINTLTLAGLRSTGVEVQTTQYGYYGSGKIASLKTPDGSTTSYVYDAMDRLIRQYRSATATPDLRDTRATYNGAGWLTSETDAQGVYLAASDDLFAQTERQRLLGLAAPLTLAQMTGTQKQALLDAYTTRYTYDSAGRRTSSTDGRGKKTLYTYDLAGRLTDTINADGEVTETTYNTFGQAESSRTYSKRLDASVRSAFAGGLMTSALSTALTALKDDSVDARQATAYNLRGLVKEIRDAFSNKTTLQYTAFGERKLSVGDLGDGTGRQLQTAYGYDRRGLATSVDAAGSKTQSVYDAFGRVLKIIDPRGNETQYAQDKLGRTITVTDALGGVRRTDYDAFDRVLASYDALGKPTKFVYDTANRKVTMTTPEGIVSATESDRFGHVVKLTDGTGAITTYTYDRNGRLLSTTDTLGNITRNLYDVVGNVVNVATGFVADATGTPIDGGSGTVTTYTYDVANRVLTQQIDPSGLNIKTSYAYDGQGRRIKLTDATNVVTTYAFDANGRLKSATVDDATGGLKLQTAYTYDAAGHTLTAVEGAGTPTAKTTQYVYDVLGRRTQEITDPGTGKLNLTTTYEYDSAGNVVLKRDGLANATRYLYDKVGRLKYTIDATGSVTQNLYDANGRLTGVKEFANRIAANSAARIWMQPGTNSSLSTASLGRFLAGDVVTATVRFKAESTVAGEIFLGDISGPDPYDNDVAALTYGTRSADGWQTMTVTQTMSHDDDMFVFLYGNRDGAGATSGDSVLYDNLVVSSVKKGTVLTEGFETTEALGNGPTWYVSGPMGQKTQADIDLSIAGRTDAQIETAVASLSTAVDRLTQYAYNSDGRRTFVIDPLGAVTRMRYDKGGRVIETIRYATLIPGTWTSTSSPIVDGTRDQSTLSVYDAIGRLRFTVDALNFVTQTNYDRQGRVTVQKAYARSVSRAALTGTGDPTETGVATAVLAQLDAANDRTQYMVYDAASRMRFQVDAEGYATERQFDALGQVTAVLRHATKLTYSALPTLAQAAADTRFTTAFDTDLGGFTGNAGVWEAGKLKLISQPEAGGAWAQTNSSRTLSAGASVKFELTPNAAQQSLHAGVESRSGGYLRLVTLWGSDGHVRVQRYDANGWKGPDIDLGTYAVGTTYVVEIATSATGGTVYVYAKGTSRDSGYIYQNDATQNWTTLGIMFATSRGPSLPGVTTAFIDNVEERNAIVSSNSYDAAGRLVSTVAASGVVTRYSYDAAGRLTDETAAAGLAEQSKTHRVYDGAGRLLEETLGYGSDATATTRFRYDANGRLIAQIESRGVALAESDATWARSQRTEMGYSADVAALAADKKQLLLDRFTTRYGYDAAGQRTAVIDPFGMVASTTYDAFGNAVKVTQALGLESHTTYAYYDKLGRAVQQVDAERYLTANIYDAFGNLTDSVRYDARVGGTLAVQSSTVPLVSVGATDPGNGRPFLITASARDTASHAEFDRLNHLLWQRDAQSYVEGSQVALDAFGQRLSVVNKLGGVASYAYDRLGHITQEALPVTAANASNAQIAVVTQHTYDSRGNRIKTIEAVGLPEQRTTQFVFDNENRLVRKISNSYTVGGSTFTPVDEFHYDACGNVIEQISGGNLVGNAAVGGKRSLAWYDAQKRKLAEVSADAVLARYTYDAAGNVLVHTIFATRLAGVPARGSADPVAATSADDRTLSYIYDVLGRKTETRLDGVWSWERKDANTPVAAIGPQRISIERLVYDALSHVVQRTDARDNASYSYFDAIGRQVLTIDAEGYATAWDYGRSLSQATKETRYASRLNAATIARQYTTPPAGASADPASLRALIPAAGPSSADRITTYDLDKLGRALEKRVLNMQTETVTSSGVRVQRVADAVTQYVYDGLGHVTKLTERAAELADGSSVWEVTDIGYDKLGRETSRLTPGFVDYLGNTVRPRTETQYDGLGNTARTVQRGTDDSVETDDRITRYGYDGVGHLIQQTDPTGAVVRYVYDAYGEITNQAQVAVKRSDGTSRDLTTSYVRDVVGRIVQETDGDTGQVKKTEYNAFGEVSRKGIGDGWQEFAYYTALGKVWKTNSGDGTVKIYLQDKNGNTTRQIKAAGSVDLRNMGLAEASQDATLLNSYSVYDKRNQLLQSMDPRMALLTSTAGLSQQFQQQWVPQYQDPNVADSAGGTYAPGTLSAGQAYSTVSTSTGLQTPLSGTPPSLQDGLVAGAAPAAITLPAAAAFKFSAFGLQLGSASYVTWQGVEATVSKVVIPADWPPGNYRVTETYDVYYSDDWGSYTETVTKQTDVGPGSAATVGLGTIGQRNISIAWQPPATTAWVQVGSATLLKRQANVGGVQSGMWSVSFVATGIQRATQRFVLDASVLDANSFEVQVTSDSGTPIYLTPTIYASRFFSFEIPTTLNASDRSLSIKAFKNGDPVKGAVYTVHGTDASTMALQSTMQVGSDGTAFVVQGPQGPQIQTTLHGGGTHLLHYRLVNSSPRATWMQATVGEVIRPSELGIVQGKFEYVLELKDGNGQPLYRYGQFDVNGGIVGVYNKGFLQALSRPPQILSLPIAVGSSSNLKINNTVFSPYSTADGVARFDLDAIRQALGISPWDASNVSYQYVVVDSVGRRTAADHGTIVLGTQIGGNPSSAVTTDGIQEYQPEGVIAGLPGGSGTTLTLWADGGPSPTWPIDGSVWQVQPQGDGLHVNLAAWLPAWGAGARQVNFQYASPNGQVTTGAFTVTYDGIVTALGATNVTTVNPQLPFIISGATALSYFRVAAPGQGMVNIYPSEFPVINNPPGTFVWNALNRRGQTLNYEFQAVDANGVVLSRGSGQVTIASNGTSSYTQTQDYLRALVSFTAPLDGANFELQVRNKATGGQFNGRSPLRIDTLPDGRRTFVFDVDDLAPANGAGSASIWEFQFASRTADGSRIVSKGTGDLRIETNHKTSTSTVREHVPIPVLFRVGRGVAQAQLKINGVVVANLPGTWVPAQINPDGSPGELGYTRFTWDAADTEQRPAGTYDYELIPLDGNGVRVIDEIGRALTQGGRVKLDPNGSQPVQLLQPVQTFNESSSIVVSRLQSYNAFGEVVEERDERVADRMKTMLGVSTLTQAQQDAARTTLRYNNLGLLISKADPETSITLANGYAYRDRPTTSYGYDLLGRVASTTDANGNMSRQAVLAGSDGVQQGGQAHASAEYFADGGVRQTAYDIFGDARKLTDQEGNVVQQSFDKDSRLVKVERLGVQHVDLNGNPVAGKTLTTTYEYDQLGQRLRTTDALNQVSRTDYDGLGRIVQTVDDVAGGPGLATRYLYEIRLAGQADGVASLGGDPIGGVRKTTTGPDGRATVDKIDYFGRTTWHQDESGAQYTYNYDRAARLVGQTGTAHAGLAAQSISYTYYANGYIQSMVDNTLNTTSEYGYDDAGNRVYEGYFQGIGNAKNGAYQVARITYDELNRMSRIQDTNYFDIRYEYDAVGNRRRVESVYWDGVAGLRNGTQVYWYDYDALNRFTVTKGALNGARSTNKTDAAKIVAGTEGTVVGYDRISQRRTASYLFNTQTVNEAYTYSQDGYLQTVGQGGALKAVRVLDDLGRTVQYADKQNNTLTTSSYDRQNRLTQQVYADNADASRSGTTAYTYYTDTSDTASSATGTGQLAKTTFTPTNGSGATTTTYQYAYWDDAKQTRITKSAAVGTGLTTLDYNANGHLFRTYDQAANLTTAYFNNASGLVLKRERTQGSNAKVGSHFFYYADGRRVGDVSDDPSDNPRVSYAEQLAAKKLTEPDRKDLYENFKPVTSADFDQNFEPINESYPGSAASSYTVRGSEDLRSIALSLWGDRAMWYLLADANGLSGAEALKPGQVLVIPNKVTNIHNNADTFRPYSAGEAIGRIDPTLPAPPPPPGKDGCGAIGTIIMVVIAVVVTVYTAGAAAGALGASTSGFAAGTSVLTGAGASLGLSTGASLAAAAIGGAVGSVVSQGFGVATGMQDSFSWKQVGLSALGSAVTAGVGMAANSVGALSALKDTTNAWVMAGRAALSSGVTQALRGSWNWQAVMASAVGGGTGTAAQGAITGIGGVGTSLAAGMIGGTAAQWAGPGGKANYASVFAGTLGNALGSSLAEAASSPSQTQPSASASGGGASGSWGGMEPIDYSLASGGPVRFGTGSVEAQPTPEELQAAFRQSERDYRSSTEQSVAGSGYVARSGDGISRIVGSSNPQAIGNFMRANNLTSDRIEVGRNYFVPDDVTAYGDSAAVGQFALNQGNERIAAARAASLIAADGMRIGPTVERAQAMGIYSGDGTMTLAAGGAYPEMRAPAFSARQTAVDWVSSVVGTSRAGNVITGAVDAWLATPELLSKLPDAVGAIPSGVVRLANGTVSAATQLWNDPLGTVTDAMASGVDGLRSGFNRTVNGDGRAMGSALFALGTAGVPLGRADGAINSLGYGALRSPSELMGIEPASAELLAAVGAKRSLVIARPGSEELRMLDYFGAEASVGGVNNSSILLRENPSKAAVLEEFLHGTQARLGIVDRLGTSGLGSAETHVKDFMMRHQQMLGLSNEDVRILKILRDKGL